MEDKKKITMLQLICLITISEIMHQYTYLPILHTIPENQDSWLTLVAFVPYVIILCLPILFLLNKFKNITFANMMTLILGKLGGKIAIFTFCLFFCFCNISCLALSVVFLKNYILLLTPTYAIVLTILIPVTYLCFKGLKTMCRLSIIAISSIIFITILFFLFSISQLNFQLLRPVMADTSFLTLNIGGFITASRFSDILILLVAASRLYNQKDVNRVFFMTVISYVLITLIILIPVLTLLGVGYGLQIFNPYYLFARQVEFYTFLQRSEVFVMVTWLSGAILKISIYHYLMSYYFAKIFNVKNYKPFIIPIVAFSFLLIILLGLDNSYIIGIIRSDAVFPWIVLFFILVVPIIILIVYFIRRKKIEGNKYLVLQE